MHNAFYLRKTAIFFKIAPMAPFTLWKSANDAFWKSKTVVQKIFHGTWSGHMVGAHGRGTYDQHESLRLRRGVLQFTLPTSREHITLTHSHSRTYTPKDIIRTQKIYLLGNHCILIYFSSMKWIGALRREWLSRNAFSLKKTHIFFKIAPISKMVNAQRVFLKENTHFLQDRPHLKNG